MLQTSNFERPFFKFEPLGMNHFPFYIRSTLLWWLRKLYSITARMPSRSSACHPPSSFCNKNCCQVVANQQLRLCNKNSNKSPCTFCKEIPDTHLLKAAMWSAERVSVFLVVEIFLFYKIKIVFAILFDLVHFRHCLIDLSNRQSSLFNRNWPASDPFFVERRGIEYH